MLSLSGRTGTACPKRMSGIVTAWSDSLAAIQAIANRVKRESEAAVIRKVLTFKPAHRIVTVCHQRDPARLVSIPVGSEPYS